RLLRGDEDVDVLHALAAATRAPGELDADRLGERAELRDELARLLARIDEQEAAARLREGPDRLEDLLLRLLAHALEARDAALLAGLLEVLDRLDLEL